jgi:hypothetical protein
MIAHGVEDALFDPRQPQPCRRDWLAAVRAYFDSCSHDVASPNLDVEQVAMTALAYGTY